MRLDSLWQDLRFGARQLRKSPGFTAVALLSLGLGIGANTAIFQLVDAVRLRTLPVKDPQELITVEFEKGSALAGWWSSRSARHTHPIWQEIQARQQAFSGMLAWSATRFNLSQGGEARYAEGLFVSGEFFRHLGVSPVAGRVFTADDDTPACPSPGAVISYAMWQREFGGEPGAIGRTLNLDGRPFPVIGVTPPAFFGVEVGNRYDVAIPICADNQERIAVRHAFWLSIMGRMKPGWNAARVDAHLKAISPGVTEATLPPIYRTDLVKRFLKNKLTAIEGANGVSGLRTRYEQPLTLLLATTGLVLLIACANLANLLLARASIREREMAVRLSLGASRIRLIRQLLAESLLLALLGAILGAGLAQAISRALVAFLSTPNSPLFVGLDPDWRVLGFTVATGLMTCLLFGLLPAIRSTRLSPAAAMRAGGRGTTAGRDRFTLRRALVATQVALSLVLLVGALLFVRSLGNLMSVNAGFKPDGILAVSLNFGRRDLPGPDAAPAVKAAAKDRAVNMKRDLLDRIARQPGVVSAAVVNMTPVSGSGWNNNVGIDGKPAENSGQNSFFNQCSPGYFRTMGTAIVAGRDFNDRDTEASPKVAIVNQEFVRKFMGGTSPIGRIVRRDADAGKQEDAYQVVGVIENTKYYQLREDPLPIVFLPDAQDGDRIPGGANFVVRAAGAPADVMSAVARAVGEVSPAINIEFRQLAQQVNDSLLRDRLMATLSGGFGLLAGLLATLGLYGVISYMVARRRNEIGVRIALGAGRGRLIAMVLREAGAMLAVGLVIGVGLSIWAGRAAETLLFGLKANDPLTIAVSSALLAVVAIAAAFFPARRAASVDPMTALREE